MLQCKTASENAFGFTTAPVGWICMILDAVKYTKCQNEQIVRIQKRALHAGVLFTFMRR